MLLRNAIKKGRPLETLGGDPVLNMSGDPHTCITERIGMDFARAKLEDNQDRPSSGVGSPMGCLYL